MADQDKQGNSENNDAFINLDNLLEGLLLDTKIVSSTHKKQDTLSELLSSERETVLDDPELPSHLAELQRLANQVDNRLINLYEPFQVNGLKINYVMELNPAQLAAVRTIDCPLLVIAGAGSGKTRVISYKVSYLIEKGMEAGQILLLTFTKKAASELLNRVQQLLKSKSAAAVLGGTFHAFANYVLRKYHMLIGLPPNFTIVDGEDVADIISLLKT